MSFRLQNDHVIARTIFEEDCTIFSSLFKTSLTNYDIDQRLLLMLTTGILHRSLHLEKYLIAVLGQKWTFLMNVTVGQTLSCAFLIKAYNTTKKIYTIHIQLHADHHLVATGIWTIKVRQSIT